MTDRELLELAAKAAGLRVVDRSYPVTLYVASDGCCGGVRFNPLSDGGAALRLAVQLRFTCEFYDNAPPEIDLPRVCAVAIDHRTGIYWAVEPVRGNEDEAMCRAIVLAAAAVGRNVK